MRSQISVSHWVLALVAGIGVSFAMLPQAKGELVYEADPRVENRTTEREVMSAANKAAVSVQSEPIQAAPVVQQVQPVVQQQVLAPAQAPQIVLAPAAIEASPQQPPANELEHYSKAELMRRERVRAEVKNEDILTERLEDLRLRDERRRTEQLMGSGGLALQDAQASSAVAAPGGVREELVGAAAAPVAQTPVAVAGSSGSTGAVQYALVPAGVVTASEAALSGSSTDSTSFWIAPRAGLSNMRVSSYFQVAPHYSAGVAGGVSVSDHLSFELGYTFNEYGIALAQSYPWLYQPYGAYETRTLRQNVGDAGLKLHLLGPNAKLRPFIGGGVSYAKSYLNFSQPIQNQLIQSGLLAPDYETDAYLGYLSAGFDIRVSTGVSIAASVKYSSVLSARENQNLYANYFAANPYIPAGLYGGSPYGYADMTDPETRDIGSSLSLSSFYTISGGVNFTF